MKTTPTLPPDSFDSWLDAYVAGPSTPASRTASESTDAGRRDAARQFHDLARRAEPTATDPSLPTTWEDFMNVSTAAAHTHPRPAPTDRRLVPAGPATAPQGRKPLMPFASTGLHHAANMLLAATILLALSAGIWRATEGTGDSPNGNGPGTEDEAAFAPDTTVWEPATPGASDTITVTVLPTAEECTVAPLTVDEVLWYIDDPIAANRSRVMGQPATPDTGNDATSDSLAVTAVPTGPASTAQPDTGNDLTPVPAGPASEEQLAVVAEVQRMWMACVLAGSPFQRWALESPSLVAEQVRPLFPNFVTRDEARRILEDVEASGETIPADDFWRTPNASYLMIVSEGFPALGTVALIDQTPANSWMVDGRTGSVGYILYDMEDATVIAPGNLTAAGTPFTGDEERPVFDACSAFAFTWFPERSEVLISGIPRCG